MQMEKIKAGARHVAALPGHLSLVAGAYLASTALAYATTTTTNADVKGALQSNKDAMTAVKSSSLTSAGAADGLQQTTNIVLYAAGLVGIVVAFIGLFMVYKHNKEGDRAQGSAASGWIVVGIGGLITIVAIATAVVPNLLLA